MVSVYFTVFPQEAEAFYAEATAYQEEQEAQAEGLSDKVCQYVQKMKKTDVTEIAV